MKIRFWRLDAWCIQVAVWLVLCTGWNNPAHASTEELRDALERFSSSVVEHTLSNGMKVLLYRRGIAPVFAGVVQVKVGGVNEIPGHTGISHLLEHMAFKGTQDFGTRDKERELKLLAELEEIALQTDSARNFSEEQKQRWDAIQTELEGIWEPGVFDREYKMRGAVGLNATTGKDLTTYFVNFPKNTFEFWAWAESERILNPSMRQFYRERDVVMEERRMRYEDSPVGRLYERLLGVSYLEHPYRNPVIGYEHDVQALLASETLTFQKAYYVPKNIVVSVVGDIDSAQALPVLEKYFGRIPAAPAPDEPEIVESEQDGERNFTVLMPASPQMLIAYKKPNYPHPDDAPITVLEEILAGSKISPLQRRLVQKEQSAASVSVFEAPGNAYPNLVVFSLTPRAPVTGGELLESFDRIVREFVQRPPSDRTLAIAKRSIAMSYLSSMNSNLALAQELSNSQLLYGDWRALIAWFEEVMKVTPDEVQRVAQEYLVPSNRTVGRVESSEEEA